MHHIHNKSFFYERVPENVEKRTNRWNEVDFVTSEWMNEQMRKDKRIDEAGF